MVRKTVLVTLLIVMGLPFTLMGQAGSSPTGRITYESSRPSVRVSVATDSPDRRTILQKCIRLHGGLTLVADNEAVFALTFRSGAGDLELEIASGRPRQQQWRETFAGTGPAALAAAMDRVVEKLLGLPGMYQARLAFISDRTGHAEVYIGDFLFRDINQVTRDRSTSMNPHFSPDGRSIVYTGYYRNNRPDLYQINLSSGRRTVLASFDGTNAGGTISPEGARVALVLSGTGNSELYVSNRRGTDLLRLTRTDSLEADPTWSPDGSRIAFSSDAMGRPQLYQIPARGGRMQRIPTDISGYCAEPDWNAQNPRLLAFTCAQRGEFEVAIHDFGTGESRVVTTGPGDAIEPVWLPDGRHLIYTERRPERRRLMVLDTVSGSVEPLHDAGFGDTWMADVVDP